MLTHLSIRNIVLVEKAEIPFVGGLCVLTGETGAGKSILLDALGLALGRRAEAKLVRAGEKNASVTACFDVSGQAFAALEALGIPIQDELIIRRTLSAEGKGKCFINDQPVSVSALKSLGESLIEVHGQHDQRGLMEVRYHLDLLDLYGGHARDKVANAYATWREHEKRLQALLAQLEQAAKEQDYLEHLVDELSRLNVQLGEADALAEKRTAMMQGEKLSGVLSEALDGLQGDHSAAGMLRDVQRLLLRNAPKEGALFDGVIEALEKAQIEVQQGEELLEALQEKCAYNPHELERIEERLFAIRAAARKHGCEADALPELCERSAQMLKALSHDQSACVALEADIAKAKAEYETLARALSESRAKTARKLEKALLKELAPLKMEKCRFQVAQSDLAQENWSARGMDHIAFEVATNAGQPFAALHQVASGGELSRFMLALKVVLSSVKSTPTLIFDEIDTGTGGAVADAIGARLAMLAKAAQVLVVTHLPQVAARGNHHLYIAKTDVKGATQTAISLLPESARKEELARMLAGAEVTQEARSAAQKLLEAAG
jgi:DNA repair protein RecN (Recombination protein N)